MDIKRTKQSQIQETIINSAPWEIFHVFLPSADFFQNQLFQTILSETLSDGQTDWIQIRPDICPA